MVVDALFKFMQNRHTQAGREFQLGLMQAIGRIFA
jgi:hypothetical protein